MPQGLRATVTPYDCNSICITKDTTKVVSPYLSITYVDITEAVTLATPDISLTHFFIHANVMLDSNYIAIRFAKGGYPWRTQKDLSSKLPPSLAIDSWTLDLPPSARLDVSLYTVKT